MPVGRPALKQKYKRVQISCTVSPEASEALTKLNVDNISHFIDLAIIERAKKLFKLSKSQRKSR